MLINGRAGIYFSFVQQIQGGAKVGFQLYVEQNLFLFYYLLIIVFPYNCKPTFASP